MTDDRQDEQNSVFQAYKEAELAIKAAFLPAPGKVLHPALQSYLQQQNHFLVQVLTTIPRDAAHIWKAIPCTVENFPKQNIPRPTITKKKCDLGIPKSALGLPGWEDSEGSEPERIFLPFPRHATL